MMVTLLKRLKFILFPLAVFSFAASVSCIYSGIDKEIPVNFRFSINEITSVRLPGTILLPLRIFRDNIIAVQENILYVFSTNDMSKVWEYDMGEKITGYCLTENEMLAVTSGEFSLSVFDIARKKKVEGFNLRSEPLFEPISDAGRLFVFLKNGDFFVDGSYFTIPVRVSTLPSINKNYIYFASNDSLILFDIESLEIRWTKVLSGNISSSVYFYEDRLFCGTDDNYFMSASAKNGQLKWKLLTGGYSESSPIVIADRLYACSYDSILYCLDPVKGRRIWNSDTAGRCDTPPSGYGNFVIMKPYTSHSLKLFSIASGEMETEYTLEDEDDFFTVPAVVSGEKFFAATYNGRIISFELLVEKCETASDDLNEEREHAKDKGEKKTYSFE